MLHPCSLTSFFFNSLVMNVIHRKQFIKWHANIMQEKFKLKKDMQCFEFLE
jgi:hypothetical protein